MELCFGHGSLEIQQQLVVPVLRVVDRLLVYDHDPGNGTKSEQSLPVLGTARQARDLDGEDGPGFASGYAP